MRTPALLLSPDLLLPIDAATQTFAFIARKGAGKTYTAGKLVELLLEAGVQVVVLDTVGNWYGLRLSADGKSKGFDVPVLGGLRGDIPLEAAGGALIADIVVDTGRSLVLDASQFSLEDRKRFATSFGKQLWQRKKAERHPTPLHLVIEESQLIVPQFTKGAEAMVGIYEEIIRLGRNYGIGVSMITQRPQSVNKEVLNQTECLLVGQVNGAQERDALKKWISHQGMDVHLVDELPSLKVGTFYVWSPQWLNLLQKVQIAPKTTFDASATPKVGDKRVARELKPLDLSELQTRMAATIEKAKADDPRELRKRIADLERQLKNAPAQSTQTKNVSVLTDADRALLDRFHGRLAEMVAKLTDRRAEHVDRIVAAIGVTVESVMRTFRDEAQASADEVARVLDSQGVQKILEKLSTTQPTVRPSTASTPRSPLVSRVATPLAQATGRSPARQVSQPAGDGTLSGPELKILSALAELEALGLHPADKIQLGLMAGYTNVRSGGFSEPLGRLIAGGFAASPRTGQVAITSPGRELIGRVDAPQTPAEMQARVMGKLTGPEQRLLKVLIDEYPNALTKEDLGARCHYTNIRSGGFSEPLGRLNTLGLVHSPVRGEVAASPVLFLEATR